MGKNIHNPLIENQIGEKIHVIHMDGSDIEKIHIIHIGWDHIGKTYTSYVYIKSDRKRKYTQSVDIQSDRKHINIIHRMDAIKYETKYTYSVARKSDINKNTHNPYDGTM